MSRYLSACGRGRRSKSTASAAASPARARRRGFRGGAPGKVSARLVADQRVDEAVGQLKAAVAAACPRGVTAELKGLHTGEPSLTDPDNPFIRAAAEALREAFGKDTVYIRSGGSIPIVGVFD